MTMLDQALGYARRGWAVQPMTWPVINSREEVVGCSCGPNCDRPGKHPIVDHNSTFAPSTDPTLITLWWRRYPRANIRIATGRISGVIVLDVDPRNDGDRSIARILAIHGRPQPTPAVITGGHGRHIYWRHPGGPIKTILGLAPGLDLLSDGAGAIAPPSLHVSGRRYAWHRDGRLDQVEIQDAPPWLWDRFVARTDRRDRAASKALQACKGHRIDPDLIPPIVDGTRNDEIMRVACRLRWEQRTQTEASRLLHQINKQCCQPPLSRRELDRIIDGVYRRYAR